MCPTSTAEWGTHQQLHCTYSFIHSPHRLQRVLGHLVELQVAAAGGRADRGDDPLPAVKTNGVRITTVMDIITTPQQFSSLTITAMIYLTVITAAIEDGSCRPTG